MFSMHADIIQCRAMKFGTMIPYRKGKIWGWMPKTQQWGHGWAYFLHLLHTHSNCFNQSINQYSFNESCQTQLKTAKILEMYIQYKIAKKDRVLQSFMFYIWCRTIKFGILTHHGDGPQLPTHLAWPQQSHRFTLWSTGSPLVFTTTS